MKRLIFMIIIIIFSVSCNNNKEKKKSKSKQHGNIIMKNYEKTFYYDSLGKISCMVRIDGDNKDFIDSICYTYDNENRIVKKIKYNCIKY